MTISQDLPLKVPKLVSLSSSAICGRIETAANKRNERMCPSIEREAEVSFNSVIPKEEELALAAPQLLAADLIDEFDGNEFEREAIIKERLRSRQPPRPKPASQKWHDENTRKKMLTILERSAEPAICAGTSYNLHERDIQYYAMNMEMDILEKSDSFCEYLIRLARAVSINLRLASENGLKMEVSEYNSDVEERVYNNLGFDPGKIVSDSSGNVPNLPITCSQMLFSMLKRMLIDKDATTQDAVLRLFTDSVALPLNMLDLSKMMIDDCRVHSLLQAHCASLISLNITGCRRLTPTIQKLVRGLHFPLLQRLIIGGCLQIYKNWNRGGSSLNSSRASSCSHLAHMDESKDSLSTPEDFCEVAYDYANEVSTTDLDEQPEDRVDLWACDFDSVFNKLIPIARLMQVPEFAVSPLDLYPYGSHISCCCPNLHTLVIHGCSWDVLNYHPRTIPDFLHMVLAPLHKLRILDLSYWERLEDLRFLRPLEDSLHTLVLYNVPNLCDAVLTICQLKSLRVLDVSQGNSESGSYPKPVCTLQTLVNSLQMLESLDISSTNLATQASEGDWPDPDLFRTTSDIPGLRPLRHHLTFLGLFNCDAASHYRDIPALQIAGDANETQVLLAMRMYMNRLEILQAALNETYQIYRFGSNLKHHTESLHIVLEAMNKYSADLSLQIAGSASLFYIIREVEKSPSTKNKVISALIRGMENHISEQVMVRNCCLSLCQFEIPQELLFDYKRAAQLLVRVMETHREDHMTQRIVVFLLNSMACHVEGVQKVTVGQLRAIEVILAQIRHKQAERVCDEVMEVSWSFLWNITDETEVNCFKFLENDGMIAFKNCYETFPDKTELVRNMMGLVGNIAEVQRLRHYLMDSTYISIFTVLLSNNSDGIEISYNSAGVLAHLISDGAEVWTVESPDRETTSNKLREATSNWDLKAKRFINYRSFGPILRLVNLNNCEASQHWALWALANLTTVDGPKYCEYVINEDGFDKLVGIVNQDNIDIILKELANIVLDNIKKIQRRKEQMEENDNVEQMEVVENESNQQ